MPDRPSSRTTRTTRWVVEHQWPKRITSLDAQSEDHAHQLAALYEDKGVPGTVIRLDATITRTPVPAPGGTDA